VARMAKLEGAPIAQRTEHRSSDFSVAMKKGSFSFRRVKTHYYW